MLKNSQHNQEVLKRNKRGGDKRGGKRKKGGKKKRGKENGGGKEGLKMRGGG